MRTVMQIHVDPRTTADTEKRVARTLAEVARLTVGLGVDEGWREFREGAAAVRLRVTPHDYDAAMGELGWRAAHWERERDADMARYWRERRQEFSGFGAIAA